MPRSSQESSEEEQSGDDVPLHSLLPEPELAAARTAAPKGEKKKINLEEEIFSDVDRTGVIVFLLWCLGVYVRFKGILNDEYRELAASRVEVVTPITDFSRIREGCFLWTYGSSPYAGESFHNSPLLLPLLCPFAGRPPPVWCLSFLIVGLQVLTAGTIYNIAVVYEIGPEARDDCAGGGLGIGDEKEELEDFALAAQDPNAVDAASINPESLALRDRQSVAGTAALAYFLNPYTILTSVALSTLVIDHLFLSAAILAAMKGSKRTAAICVATASMLSPYALTLLPPIFLLLKRSRSNWSFKTSAWELFKWTLLVVVSSCAVAASMAYPVVAGATAGKGNGSPQDYYTTAIATAVRSCEWVRAVYLFPFTVPDLTPNVGLFWYFFIEVFKEFKGFFLFVFQYSMLVCPLALSLRLRHRPTFLAVLTLGITAIFKSYPSVGDAALYLPLLLVFHKTLADMRRLYVLAQVFLFVTVLAPIFWDGWVVTGVGNANFYYALTLAYGIAQVMIVSEALLAVMRADKRTRFCMYLNQHSEHTADPSTCATRATPSPAAPATAAS